MKDNFIHVCFVIDESGSMFNSIDDVKGGYAQTIAEQKKETDGQCAVSMYTFSNGVTKHYIGKDVNEVSPTLDYNPGGMTAMNDGIGTAIDEIGKWLAGMPEEERPSQNMIVIMTDGQENASTEYSLKAVQEKIKEQTEKYNWTFVYLGTDITTTKDVDALGIKTRAFATRADYADNYNMINTAVTSFRKATKGMGFATMDSVLNLSSQEMNAKYAMKTGNNMTSK